MRGGRAGFDLRTAVAGRSHARYMWVAECSLKQNQKSSKSPYLNPEANSSKRLL